MSITVHLPCVYWPGSYNYKVVMQFTWFLSFRFVSLSRCLTLRHRGFWRESITGGLETTTVPNDLKDGYDSRRNQQVYSASPVKTVNKHNDSGK